MTSRFSHGRAVFLWDFEALDLLLTQAKEGANNFYIFLKSTFSQAVPTVQLLQTFKPPCYCMQNADSYYIIIPDTQLNSLCLNSQIPANT